MGRTSCTDPQCLYKGALYFLLNFLTDYKHVLVHTILDILENFNFKKFYYGFYAHPVNSMGFHNV
jgi:hypothetical protein